MANFQNYSKPRDEKPDFEKLIRQWKKQAMENREVLKEKEFYKKKSVIRHEKAIQRRRTIAKNNAKMAKIGK